MPIVIPTTLRNALSATPMKACSSWLAASGVAAPVPSDCRLSTVDESASVAASPIAIGRITPVIILDEKTAPESSTRHQASPREYLVRLLGLSGLVRSQAFPETPLELRVPCFGCEPERRA